MTQALIIFAKNEVVGTVKTRLAATIGNENALQIYKTLLKHSFHTTYALPFSKTVFYSDYVELQDLWHNASYNKKVQRGEDLGEKMKNAFAAVFGEGAQQAVIMGTDCPQLNADIIHDAFDALAQYDIVIGPAHDGGYYLLAMKTLYPELFSGIPWSTHLVLQQTLQICQQLNLSVYLLPKLTDIDTEEDLKKVSIETKMVLHD